MGYLLGIIFAGFSLTLQGSFIMMINFRNILGILLVASIGLAGFTLRSDKDVEPSVKETVQWMSFEEAIEKNKISPKKIFIDVYTDWCGWCKKMDAGTFNNPVVAKYLNEKYYNVKLDAEGKDPIEFDGHTFKWVNTGRNGIHELAYALLSGKMSYPTVVFLDEQFRIIQPLPGYQKAPFFDKVIKFYGEDYHKEKTWDDFIKGYNSPLE